MDLLANKIAFENKIFPNIQYLLQPYLTKNTLEDFPTDLILDKLFLTSSLTPKVLNFQKEHEISEISKSEEDPSVLAKTSSKTDPEIDPDRDSALSQSSSSNPSPVPDKRRNNDLVALRRNRSSTFNNLLQTSSFIPCFVDFTGPNNPIQRIDKFKYAKQTGIFGINTELRCLYIKEIEAHPDEYLFILPIEAIKEIRLGKKLIPYDENREPIQSYKSRNLLTIFYGNLREGTKFNLDFITIHFHDNEIFSDENPHVHTKFELWKLTLGLFLLENINQPSLIRKQVWESRLILDNFLENLDKKNKLDLVRDKLTPSSRINFKFPRKFTVNSELFEVSRKFLSYGSMPKALEATENDRIEGLQQIRDYHNFIGVCFNLKQNVNLLKYLETNFSLEMEELRPIFDL